MTSEELQARLELANDEIRTYVKRTKRLEGELYLIGDTKARRILEELTEVMQLMGGVMLDVIKCYEEAE